MEFWFSEFHTPDVKHSIRVNKQLYSKQSDYQRIDIFETPEFGRVLTLDGNVMLTERDEFIYDEMIVHVPMAVHKEAKDILVIGAGDGGVVRELTRYDRVERIDLVEMDPQVVEACRAYLPGNACRMDDRRVHIYFENALKYIRRCEEEYDLIIVDSSDPFGNRPDAIFACSDLLAVGAINAAKQLKLDVPHDVSVVGFDNIELTTMITPTITTIEQPCFQIGYQSCELLIEKITNPKAEVKQIILDTELIVRDSTVLCI